VKNENVFIYKKTLFIFFRVEEYEPKEDAVSRGPYGAALRVVDTAGARGNSSRFQRDSDKSARFFPVASPMLGAGQREATSKP
jgi:hypothetical protein